MAESKDDLLRNANKLIAEMQDQFQRLGEAGLDSATILDLHGKYALLSTGTYALNKNFKVGQNVLIYPRTGQVVETIDHNPFLGEVFVIDTVKDNWVEVRIKGDRKLISKGAFNNLKAGDSVLLDQRHTIVQLVVEHLKETPRLTNPVHWDQIGGQDEAKRHLQEAIELPYLHPKLYKAYGQRDISGILLYGPPGCGKTMLGKAVATSIDSGFILINGPEVLNEYVGVAEANIRSAFMRARAYKAETGKPAVIFVDEAESLLTTRGSHYNHMGQTIVPTFLVEMNGIEDSSAIVILSTNRADVLDPAIIRDGRIDFKVEVKRPDINDAKKIVSIYMDGKPIHKGNDKESLIERSTGELYQHKLPFSGALFEGLVTKAVTHALRRDTQTGKLSGLATEDFDWAANQIINQELKNAA